MSERVLDIVDRLRGKYVLAVNDGGGLLDGKDTVTRDFGPMPPIWQEAAKEIEALRAETARLSSLLNTPEIIDFALAVQIEAAHQRERWGSDHDAGKTEADWFWLIGYLTGKALMNPDGDQAKRLHRIVTVAAAACNWHAATLGQTNMRPGIETPTGELTTEGA